MPGTSVVDGMVHAWNGVLMSRRQRVSTSILSGVLLLFAALGSTGAGPVDAQAPPTGIDITILPSVLGETTAAVPTVSVDGVALAPAACTLTEFTGAAPRPGAIRQLQCPDLPDGVYSVDIGGVEAGNAVAVRCIDIVASRAPASSVPIVDGFGLWSCEVFVGPPAIQIINPADDPIGTEIRDVAGAVISDACTDVPTEDSTRLSCGPLALGVYTTAATIAVDDDGLDDVVCQPLDSSEILQINSSPQSRGRVVLSDVHPIWGCYLGEIGPLLGFSVQWIPAGEGSPDLGWISTLTAQAIESTSGDADGACSFPAESGAAALDAFIDGSCADLPDGTYRLVVSGIPEALFVQGDCDVVVVYEFDDAYCSIQVSNQAFPEPEPDPGPQPTDVDELPATGQGTGMTVAVAMLLLFVGSVLVAGGRRRTLS